VCGSTCFGHLPTHHQEHTTALGAAAVQWLNQRLLVQLYAPDDGQGDARNMLSHTQTSSNKLVKLLHFVGWNIWIVWWCRDLRTSNKEFKLWDGFKKSNLEAQLYHKLHVLSKVLFQVNSFYEHAMKIYLVVLELELPWREMELSHMFMLPIFYPWTPHRSVTE
jgi:hypothetical protein